MKRPTPARPKEPHEYRPGPQATIRMGFWAFHHQGPKEPVGKYTPGSPLWHLYRRGYVWAQLHPTEVPDWAYTENRAMRKAVEMAIRWSAQIDTSNNKLMANNLAALRKVWQRCLKEEVWIHWSDWKTKDRVTTKPGKEEWRRRRGKGPSVSRSNTTSEKR